MAAPAEESVFSTSDDASISLLRRLHAGATVHFVHRVDVCSAAPEDLVAGLQPVPGTDLAEDGYNSVWYLYCLKRFKNAQGKPSGHRQRAIAGGDTCWHSETAPKPVKGLEGATFCNLSFGRKEGSGRSFNRMGWCMTEYDDKNDHVLCKVHRSSSSLAKEKSKNSSAGCKRKATVEHPQAPPTKMSLCASVDDQVDHHQVQPPLLTGQQMTMPESLFPIGEENQQLDQNILPPAEEQQQLEQNIIFPAEEQQQPEQNILLPGEEQQQLEQNTFFPAEEEQFEQNTLFTMEELLRSPVYDDLFNSCSGCGDTPKALGPPAPVFFEGLGLAF
ncbi:hypothetical protein HU200_010875 [Digitaria exilis]|uniref:NAC domain-containing protein n=1 Tax=Digitaria exilis TaxID=1010633 RepID=A0A835KPH5_9POAL|nr:hypothetical protein HU200_010875 [Digitaria exilis]